MSWQDLRRSGLAATVLAVAVSTAVRAEPSVRPVGAKCAVSTPIDTLLVHRMTTVNGVRLHYVVAGKGPAVVFTHGFPSTSYEWRHVMARLAGCYTTVAVDLRGMGDSERPPGGYDAFTMAQDVRALMHSLGHDKVFLVGHDIGAPVAYAYAAQYPQDVTKLVTVELVLAGAGLEDLIRDHGQQLWHFQFQAVPNLPEVLVAGRERAYLEELFRPYTYNPAAITDAAIDEYVRAYSQPGAMRAGFDYYRQIPVTAEKVKAQLAAPGKLTLPVLALAADHSMGAPGFGDPAKASIERVASNVTYEVVPDSGHWIPEERPDWLAERLDRFFRAP